MVGSRLLSKRNIGRHKYAKAEGKTQKAENALLRSAVNLLPSAFCLLPLLLMTSNVTAQEGAPDPIGELALEMEDVVIDLSGMTTGEPVQDVQKGIVTKLDKLIEELEKESEQQRGGASSANPMKPMNDSMITGGPGGIGDLHAARKTGKQWAELPPHERDRIVQSMTEGFPAHYQKILERYYKRLAEETPAAAAAEQGERPVKDADTKSGEPVKKPAKATSKDGKSAAANTTKGKES
jgi:hypothetical protein